MSLNRLFVLALPALGYGLGLAFGDRLATVLAPLPALVDRLPQRVGSEVLRHLGQGVLLGILGLLLLVFALRRFRRDPAGSMAVVMVVGSYYVHSVVRSLVILVRLVVGSGRERWVDLASYNADPVVWIVPFLGAVVALAAFLWLLARAHSAPARAGKPDGLAVDGGQSGR